MKLLQPAIYVQLFGLPSFETSPAVGAGTRRYESSTRSILLQLQDAKRTSSFN